MALFNFGKKKEEEKKAPACACNCGCPTSEVSEITSDCCPEAKDGICCIKVLGAGCKSCHEQYENAREAVKAMGLSVEVEYITDMQKVMEYGVMSMPALVVNEKVVSMGKVLKVADVEKLLQREEIKYLSEMMNFPGVLFKDEEVMKKIAAAHRLGKPVDGHAPGLRGEEARKYIEGISFRSETEIPPAGGFSGATDHECFTADEALDKLKYGMKILIREGSAAKNFEALIDLMHEHFEMMMFCSDDKHPDSLVLGHINQLCARAVAKGIPLFHILKAACVNPVLHYRLNVGLLRAGDPADFIVVDNLKDSNVLEPVSVATILSENGKSF